jgi:hypothetical protein
MISKTKIYCFLFFFGSIHWLFCQREFVISSNGIGKSEEDAIQNAIVGSMNQVFGIFYSTNTTISNDSLQLDDFATISRGNITELKIISSEKISENHWFVNINLTISLDKIEKYYESKGQSLKYDGSLFSYNIQIQELNELNETKSICNMIEIANEVILKSFNYSIFNSDPISIDEISEKWLINFKVNAVVNENIQLFQNVILKTLEGISLTQSEIENYSILGRKTYVISILENGVSKDFYLRSTNSFNILHNFIASWEGYVRSFDISCGSKNVRGNSIKKETSNLTNKDVTGVNYKNKVVVEKMIVKMDATTLMFRFPEQYDSVGIFDWFEFFKINELEEINGFKIESNELIKFKNGGFVIFEKNGHGLVLSPFEFSINEYNNKKNFNVGALSDWIVPSYEDFIMIKKYIYLNHYCNLSENVEYLTSSDGELSPISVDFHMYNAFGEFQEMIYPNQTAYIERVRLVRRF